MGRINVKSDLLSNHFSFHLLIVSVGYNIALLIGNKTIN